MALSNSVFVFLKEIPTLKYPTRIQSSGLSFAGEYVANRYLGMRI